MLDKLKTVFAEPVAETAEPQSDELHIAAAALLVRAAQIDGSMDEGETHLLRRLVGPHFGLQADAAAILRRGNPQGRFIQPDEVAAASLFLASDDAHSITGHALPLSGGEI